MARVIALVLFVALGLAFLSRSCSLSRAGGAISLVNARIVSATGSDESVEFIAIAGGKIAAISRAPGHAAPPPGARKVDVTGLYVAATTFDRSSPALIDGIRHVWIGQLSIGDPGDVVIMRANPGRIRPGFVPETNAIVAAVVDGVYYTARELNRRR